MLFEFEGIFINIKVFPSKGNAKQKIFFLHGFSGSSEDWNVIAPLVDGNFQIYAIDLIGHGRSSSPDDLKFYSPNSIENQMLKIITGLSASPVYLCGYSMGGRAALNFTIKNPSLIKGLILESTTAGIEDESERQKRKKDDFSLANQIKSNSINWFAEYWMNLPIFNSQKSLSKKTLQSIYEQKLNNSVIGLSNSLKGFGTGNFPVLYEKLGKLNVKTLLITGEKDKKYVSLNKKIYSLLPNAKHIIIQNAGHNTHLEASENFISAVNNFLRSF